MSPLCSKVRRLPFLDDKQRVDLGIDIENIKNKTLSVLNLRKCDEKMIKEADMSGPLLFALIFGSLLMLVRIKLKAEKSDLTYERAERSILGTSTASGYSVAS